MAPFPGRCHPEEARRRISQQVTEPADNVRWPMASGARFGSGRHRGSREIHRFALDDMAANSESVATRWGVFSTRKPRSRLTLAATSSLLMGRASCLRPLPQGQPPSRKSNRPSRKDNRPPASRIDRPKPRHAALERADAIPGIVSIYWYNCTSKWKQWNAVFAGCCGVFGGVFGGGSCRKLAVERGDKSVGGATKIGCKQWRNRHSSRSVCDRALLSPPPLCFFPPLCARRRYGRCVFALWNRGFGRILKILRIRTLTFLRPISLVGGE